MTEAAPADRLTRRASVQVLAQERTPDTEAPARGRWETFFRIYGIIVPGAPTRTPSSVDRA